MRPSLCSHCTGAQIFKGGANVRECEVACKIILIFLQNPLTYTVIQYIL
uniref:Uncharacterized protein n=1 Tax=Siphoviridae sp. cttpk5 TaxID=2826496 RepID=A0A8S5NHL8_9CAUD|nr:MAG TPA: hypothetical protein [Siphoviridae sp. cttpk5]